MNKTFLVTGGAGFIGVYLARRLIEAGNRVVIVDNLSTGLRENIPDGAEFLELDLSQPGFLSGLPDIPFDALFHLAAQSSGPLSAEQPLYDFQTNAVSTLLLSQWCLKKGISRFLYASSMAVYGNAEILPVPERVTCQPLSYYGISKLTSEHLLQLAANQGLHITSFRMFSVYGPGQNLANFNQGMVSIFLAYVLKNDPIPVKGTFDRFRDFVYIDDVIDAWIIALNQPVAYNKVYNVGAGQPVLVRQLLNAIIKACGYNPDTYPVFESTPTPGDQFGMYADVSRLASDLSWKPSVLLDEGIARMVAWAKNIRKSE